MSANPSGGVEPLVDGDVVVFDDNNESVVIIERKTWSDLKSSITSRHLQDQLARMKQTGGKCVLIVETPDVPAFHGAPLRGHGVSDKRAHAFLADAQLHGVVVIFARDVNEFACVCAWLHKRASEGRLSADTRGVEDAARHVPIAASARARHGTAADVRRAMIACIPGVSHKKADAILSVVKLSADPPLPDASPIKGIGPVIWKRIRDVFT